MENLESTSDNKILILGDGNFSFSLSSAKNAHSFKQEENERSLYSIISHAEAMGVTKENIPGYGESITNSILYATSYDSKEVVYKDEKSMENIKYLEKFKNVVVLDNVDATNLAKTFDRSVKFKKIVFNFPHVGGKSNIRACRELLENSFNSISEFIDENSDVLITLCRGQGGTPSDVNRNGYGNSWQVATQAAKAGLFLSTVFRFDLVAPQDYHPSGYRGKLQNGFVKSESLTHVFKKGIQMSILTEEYVETPTKETLISLVDKCYVNGLSTFNPFELSLHPFSECSSCLRKMLDGGYGSTSYQINEIFLDTNNRNHLENGERSYITTIDDWYPLDIAMEAKSNSKLRWARQVFVSSSTNISPISYPVYEEFAFLDGTSHFSSLRDFISNMMLSFQTAFHGCSFTVSWISDKCNKTGKCGSSDFNIESFDAALVPYFLSDIPMESWLSLEPDVTISCNNRNLDHGSKGDTKDQNSSLHYDKVAFNDYIMSEQELKYFSKGQREKSFCSCIQSDSLSCILKVNGVVVGKAGCCKYPDTRSGGRDGSLCGYIAVFRTDLLCLAILQVDDIRLFWSKDDLYHAHLRRCLIKQRSECYIPCPKVLYPLCYRHDICFWVKEIESEDIFFAAVRYCCQDVVHSIKLLRILCHKESGLLSFCYRMIYSRCDGPLSKGETVELQNRIRLLLIALKYDLR